MPPPLTKIAPVPQPSETGAGRCHAGKPTAAAAATTRRGRPATIRVPAQRRSAGRAWVRRLGLRRRGRCLRGRRLAAHVSGPLSCPAGYHPRSRHRRSTASRSGPAPSRAAPRPPTVSQYPTSLLQNPAMGWFSCPTGQDAGGAAKQPVAKVADPGRVSGVSGTGFRDATLPLFVRLDAVQTDGAGGPYWSRRANARW